VRQLAADWDRDDTGNGNGAGAIGIGDAGSLPEAGPAAVPAPSGDDKANGAKPLSLPWEAAGRPVTSERRRQRPLSWLSWPALATFAVVIVTVVTAWLAGVGWPTRRLFVRTDGEPPAESAPAPGQPALYAVDVGTVRILDSAHRVLWSHTFAAPLDAAKYRQDSERAGSALLPVHIEDLDGDGNREVLVRAVYPSNDRPASVVVLDSRGHERFPVQPPTHTVRFGSRVFAPPWSAFNVFITGEPPQRVLWIAWAHFQSGEFPCLLQRLSLRGTVEAEYWSAGHITSVASGTVQGRPSILVGAANNDKDHRGASLALFDEAGVRGSAPASSPEMMCRGCPAGGPRAFLVFPPAELKKMVEGFPSIWEIRVQATGEVRVVVDQQGGHRDRPLGGAIWYDLDHSLTPFRAEFSDSYTASHTRLEAEGLLNHEFGDRDHREAWPVFVWNGTRFAPVTSSTAR